MTYDEHTFQSEHEYGDVNSPKQKIIPICTGCSNKPRDIEEYRVCAKDEEMSADEWVIENEGTYNHANGHFLCTDCYIAAGMPTSPGGWIAP